MNWLKRISQNRQVSDVLFQLIRPDGGIDMQSAITQLQQLGAQAVSEACGMAGSLVSDPSVSPDAKVTLEQLSQTMCYDVAKGVPQDMPQEETLQEPLPNEIIE